MEILINKNKVLAKKGQTILEVAKSAGIEIPTLCYHSDLEIKAGCRVCVVEIKGQKSLQTSCSTKVKEGMEITTNSLAVKRARSINLSLIYNGQKEIEELAKKYNIKLREMLPRKKGAPAFDFGPSVHFDMSKCISCRNCLEVCEKQAVSFLELEEQASFHKVLPSKNKQRDCIYCGQCVAHCPVGSLTPLSDISNVERAINDKNKIVIAQFAPSIRSSIGEEFGLPHGEIVTGQLAEAIKKLGFDKVIDTSVGADFTTYEEAQEFLEHLHNKKTPCLSSCCPSWVKFLEFNYPEFIPHIAKTRSPQIILGGLIKTYWAKKQKVDPRKIVMVSIMPCTAKKYESTRKELEINGLKPVDYVLTTVELVQFLKNKKINLAKIKPSKSDDPFDVPSGSGVIYGASGGVTESVLRTAAFILSKGKNKKVDFKEVRGQDGIKRAVIKFGNLELKMAVVNGISNAKIILDELKKNKRAYDAVEVMACPGGCIGGGGQPLPTSKEIRQKRAQALYSIDEKKEFRAAHQNPVLQKVYKEYLTSKERIDSICHTKYFKKIKEVNI